MMAKGTCVLVFGAIAMILVGCQSAAPTSDPVPSNPDQAVAELRAAWESAPGNDLYGSYQTQGGQTLRSRALVRRQAQNLAFRHPTHAPTLFLNGVLAYEAGDGIEASRFLDRGLRLAPASADAAALRARIALEQGNAMFANNLLTEQIMLNPAHAGLRELLASTRFMSGDLVGAHAALDAAEQLGAPPERIAYNRGLLLEQEGRSAAAIEAYQEALTHAPSWPMPTNRLAGLQQAPIPSSAPATVPTKAMPTNGFPPAAPPPPPPITSELPLPPGR